MADHRKTDAAAAKGFPAQILPESAIELHMLLENIPGGVCLLEIGPQIRIIYASSGFFRMIGSAENEFVLPCALEALRIHPDYLAEYENALRQGAQDGEMPAQAHRLQSAAGGWIWRRAQAVRTDCACSPYPVMLELSSDISETVALEESLAESQAHLLAVLDQNPHPLWQVDIAKRSVRIYNAVSQSAIPEREFKNFPETLISRGIVHSDSAENFRKFAADLLAGKKEDSGSFIMLNSLNHCYSWFSLSYRMTFDRENNPIRAVGVLEQLPDISCLSSGYYRRSLPEIVRHHLLARMRVNLTADRTEEFWLNGTDQTSLVQGRSCSELIQFEKKQFFTKTEGEEFARRIDRASLLAAFDRGEFWSCREYRRVDSGGIIRWMSDTMNISRFTLFNPTSLASILAIQSHYPEIPAEQIELEITETAGDMEKATPASIVDNFREFGIEFDLDDFGSRYANISMFSSIRFNTIKLDRSLVNDLPDNEISRMLVENIVTICKNFGMRCVAESVETRLQEAALLKAGCIYAQGYYYSKPLPPGKFEKEFLQKGN